ncbi:MAG: methylisocitrate lyase [Gammaproteobacteria bacterium]|nr:methylisocitrate lyase [Gammaproteobacteria bacterium]
MNTPGKKFRKAIVDNNPLMIVGTINAYCAKMAENSGHKALYLSGAGVANASFGLPDLAITTLNDVVEDSRRITQATSLPLLIDVDTGFGGAFSISRTIKEMIAADVAAIHIEDQVSQKRCGHRPNKSLVETSEMNDRIKAAVDGRTDDSFFIMARTDSYEAEGINGAIDRSKEYIAAGADGLFLEAVSSLDDYKKLKDVLEVPVLANITEFGKTPLFTAKELASVGVDIMLFPLSAFRAMNKAAEFVYQDIAKTGSQKNSIEKMQTRDELYEYLNYHSFEQKLDELFERKEKN